MGRQRLASHLDDRAARKCAVVEGIPTRGTLGVLLAAKVRGLIPSAGPYAIPLCRRVFVFTPMSCAMS